MKSPDEGCLLAGRWGALHSGVMQRNVSWVQAALEGTSWTLRGRKENEGCLRGADNTIRNSMSSEIWELRNESQVCSVCGTEDDADHPQEGSKGPVHPSPLHSIKAHCVTVITLHDTTQRKMKQTGWNFYDAAELKVKHLPGAGKETREGQKRRLH